LDRFIITSIKKNIRIKAIIVATINLIIFTPLENKYSLVVDIPKFFTNEFQWFLQTVPGSIPFASDYGTHIKHAIQTKDAEIRRIEIENEINFFIHNFNNIYNSLVAVRAIKILSRENQSGGNSWLIEVEVVIEEEILTLRVESAE